MHENVDFLFRYNIYIIILSFIHTYTDFDSTRNSTQILGCIEWKDTIFIFATEF